MRPPQRARGWPLALIALPAAVAIWSGWVGLGGMCGFGVVNLLPGIGGGFRLNTAITLPVGAEAYAAFALYVWISPGSPERARKFAGWSALGALAYGALGQVVYHLLAAAGVRVAPWPVTVLVSCMPVAVLGLAAALAHLQRETEETGDGAAVVTPAPAVPSPPPVPVTVPLPSVREIRERRKCSQATAAKIRAELKLLTRNSPAPPAGDGARVWVTPGAAPAVDVPPVVPAGALNGSGPDG